MQVLAALGDAPTAAIAVMAILLGVLLVARGPREKRAAGEAGGADESGPTLLKVPVAAAPDVEPGFVGPEGTIVGHGPIRLGRGGPVRAGEPAEPEPEPEPELEVPQEPADPAPPAASEEPLFTSPPAMAGVEPPAEEAPPPPAEEPGPKEPAWRVAARAANPAAHFRQGTIKVGGKPAGKRKNP